MVLAIKLSKPLQTVFVIAVVGLLTILIIFSFKKMICAKILLYFAECRHLLFINLRILHHSFQSNKYNHPFDSVEQRMLFKRQRNNVSDIIGNKNKCCTCKC